LLPWKSRHGVGGGGGFGGLLTGTRSGFTMVILALPKCVLLATELVEAGPGGGLREIGAGRVAGGEQPDDSPTS
jgi:hypothetical protein